MNSAVSGNQSKPEEIAFFHPGNGMENLVESNLVKAVLKIEKKGNLFRLLYFAGPIEIFSFKEVTRRNLNWQLKYISLFSIRSWAAEGSYMPVP